MAQRSAASEHVETRAGESHRTGLDRRFGIRSPLAGMKARMRARSPRRRSGADVELKAWRAVVLAEAAEVFRAHRGRRDADVRGAELPLEHLSQPFRQRGIVIDGGKIILFHA